MDFSIQNFDRIKTMAGYGLSFEEVLAAVEKDNQPKEVVWFLFCWAQKEIKEEA